MSSSTNAQLGKENIHMEFNNKKKQQVKYYIYRPKMKVNGVMLYAKDYGLKAFKIPIYD